MILAVNYHYVGTPDYPYPGIHGLSIDGFMKHVSWIKRRFELIGIPDLVSAISGGTIPENACMITFDDGLRCHYEVIRSIMEKHDFPVAFFVNSKPLMRQKVSNVHKSQYVRSNLKPDEIWKRIRASGAVRGLDVDRLDQAHIKKHYRYDDERTARVKYLLNYLLPQGTAQRIIGELFQDLVENEAEFIRQWYMNREEVRELHRQFDCIGSHAHSHAALAPLPYADAKREIGMSKVFLEEITSKPIFAMSYPLGNANAVSSREARIAKSLGYSFAFTMEREINQSLQDPLLLARIDCNDLPEVGKQPLFCIDEGILKQKDGSLSRRKRYLKES